MKKKELRKLAKIVSNLVNLLDKSIGIKQLNDIPTAEGKPSVSFEDRSKDILQKWKRY